MLNSAANEAFIEEFISIGTAQELRKSRKNGEMRPGIDHDAFLLREST